MRLNWLAGSVLFVAGFSALAPAQTFPLQLRISENNQVFIVANQQTLTFASSVGQTTSAQGTATYSGSGKITVPQASQLVFGSTQFSATISGKLPLTLNPGDSFSFVIVFTPTSTSLASAIFTLPFTETVPGVGNLPPTTTANAINFTLVGAAASFVVSYIKDGNAIQLANGGTMLFDPQPINTAITLPLDIANNGSAAGQITGITVTGNAFQVLGRPVLPITVGGNQQLQVFIQYKPTAVGADTGQLQITFGDGSSLSATLQGSGTSPTLLYTLVVNGTSTTVKPNGTITLPDTNVGSTTSAVLRVQNNGSGSIIIGSINVSGQAFQLSGEPLLPKTLNTNDSFPFTIKFAPTQPGVASEQLLIGTDLFNLTGKGLGSELQFSYSAAGATLTIGTNGVTSVVFSPIQVTKSQAIPFTVKNIGTLAAVVSNIAIGETNSPYSLTGLPALPKNLAPGASFPFTVDFAPNAVGVANGTLLINSTSIPLSGSGTAPPPLPAYTISGPTGNVAPQSQPAVTLKLASAYPVDVVGVLTLTTTGTLGSDPAVQFQTFGRTVPFKISANSMVANFASQGNQILLQTGTVASTITLTPSFTTAVGGVPLTPANPTTLQFTIPAEAPVLIAVTEASSSASSVVLNFSGYSTTRTLTGLNVQFIAATGFTLGSSQVTVDLHQPAAVWFGSATSQGFGGQFTVSVPFTFSGTVPTGKTLLQTIASISATLSNEIGASNAVTSPIQ